MSKVQRLNKIHKLLKIQEQDVLAEFKELQRISDEINMQINDLAAHSANSENDLMLRPVAVSQLTLVRSFNEKVEMVLQQLNARLLDNDKNYSIVADKLKEIRSSLTSIERLTDKHQSIDDYEQESNTQKQIEENINYTLSSID